MKLSKLFGFKLFILFTSLGIFMMPPKPGECAPCCARNSATPILMIGDDRAQVNLGVGLSHAVAHAEDDEIPIFGSPASMDISRAYRLEGAYLIKDRLQVGIGLSWLDHQVKNQGQEESVFDFADTRLSLSYEILPLWNYSRWQPQIFLFSVLTLPTGRSRYESNLPTRADITGNGFYSYSLGAMFLKNWDYWDLFVLPEVHYGFSRRFNGEPAIEAFPGWGSSLGFGGGVSPGGGALRIGLRIQPRIDQAIQVSSLQNTTQPQGKGFTSVCDTALDFAYLLSASDSLMLSYSDQTLLGVARNTNLNRILGLTFQHRWEL